jgi:hypothetical protein
MISRFSVKNYKALASVTLPLTPIHVVIGQNDSGKTSLLEAIHAYCSGTQGPLLRALPSTWWGRDLVNTLAEEPQVELAAELRCDDGSTLSYEFAVSFPSGTDRRWKLDYERYSPGHGESRGIPRRSTDATTVSLRADVPLEERRDLDLIAEAVGSSMLYKLDARVMAIPAGIDPSRRFRMDADGFGLSSLIDDIKDYSSELFIALKDEFCRHFPEFQAIRLQAEQAVSRSYSSEGLVSTHVTTGKGIYFETRYGATIRAQQASDGAILFLGFLALSHIPTPPKLLLLEEPETGVYPKRLDQIITILRRIAGPSQDRAMPQIILTTHSPYVLTPFKPEEVTLLSKKDNGVVAHPLRDAPHIEERLSGGEFYLGELWFNVGEEELFSDVGVESRR